MPVLILAIASFLLFVAIVVLLAIAGTVESRAIRHKVKLASANLPALLSIAEAFDPIYSVLWEAPVAALTLIDSAGFSAFPLGNCARSTQKQLIASLKFMTAAVLLPGFAF